MFGLFLVALLGLLDVLGESSASSSNLDDMNCKSLSLIRDLLLDTRDTLVLLTDMCF